MKKNIKEIECLVCNGVHFRKGFFAAEYQKYDEDTRWNIKSEAKIHFYLESEEDNPLNRIPEQSNIYSYRNTHSIEKESKPPSTKPAFAIR